MASREDRTGTCEASCASLVYPLLTSTASCTFWIRIWPATYPDPDYYNSDVFDFMRVEFRVVPLRWPAQICKLCNLECQSFGCNIYIQVIQLHVDIYQAFTCVFNLVITQAKLGEVESLVDDGMGTSISCSYSDIGVSIHESETRLLGWLDVVSLNVVTYFCYQITCLM
jgi:hypothetical protein